MSSSSEILALALSTATRVSSWTAVPTPSRAGGVTPTAIASALVLKAASAGFASAVGGEDVGIADGDGVGGRRRKRGAGGTVALAAARGVETIYTGGARDGAGVGAPALLPQLSRAGAKAASSINAAASESASAAAVGLKPKTRGWFEIAVPELTTDVRRELAIVRNRTFLDPKRHYKTAKEDRDMPKTFAIGTYVAATGERSAPREARAPKAPTLVNALLGDGGFKAYAGRTMRTVRDRAEGGGVVAYQVKKALAGADWKKRRADYVKEHGKKEKQRKLY